MCVDLIVVFATQLHRKFQDEEQLKCLLPVGKKVPIQRSFVLSRRQASCISIAKATPSFPVPCTQLQPAPLIEESLLRAAHETTTVVGQGCFGSCSKMIYKDMFVVCSKKINDSVSLSAIRSESAILFALNDGPYTPHCFGFCVSLRSIIMMYVHVDNQPVSLQSLVNNQSLLGSTLSKAVFSDILVGVCKGLKYIHEKGFLHNDLKLDNVVLGNSISKMYLPYIIDFGKSCRIASGKRYTLTEEQKTLYKKEHTQIAPDLRDGMVSQSVLTDTYSLGRIMKRVNSVCIQSASLRTCCRKVLSYSSHERPTLQSIISVLEIVNGDLKEEKDND